MKKISVIHLLNEENKKKAHFLNLVARSSNIKIIDKKDPLILEGLLKSVSPANETQSKFVKDGQAIVQLSKKGIAFWKATMTEVVVG